MRPLGIILGLIPAFHVAARPNHGDYSRSVYDKTPYHTTAAEMFKRQQSLDPVSSFFSSILCPLTASTDCQTSDTDTATVQPTVQPETTVQPTEQPTPAQTQQPAPPPAPPPASTTTPPSPPTQSCHGTSHYWWTAYSVQIGIPYGGAKDCDATYHALESSTTSITNWQCVEKDGDIQLWFNAFANDGAKINSALESRYPSVAGGFNCPDI
jgi:hypothetical protein